MNPRPIFRPRLPGLVLAPAVAPAVALLVLALASPAAAEPDAALEERALLLDVELRRGPARKLFRLLGRDRDAATRTRAIRALGRIGDRMDVNAVLALLVDDATEPQRRLAIWSAGIARAAELYEPLARAAKEDDPAVAAAAAAALGWCPDPRVPATLAPLLGHASPAVREGALVGLGRARAHEHLEAAIAHLDAEEPEVRAAADFACWLTAYGRRAARMKEAAEAEDGGQKAWDGDAPLAAAFTSRLAHADPRKRMAGLRPLGVLLPKRITREEWPAVFALLDDADPRVVQDLVSRVLEPREGPDVDAALADALGHADPKVRGLAAEALGQRGRRAPLLEAFAGERDVRLRFRLAVAIARTGDLSAWRVAAHLRWPADPAIKERAEILCHLLAGKLEDAVAAAEVAHPWATAALFEELGDRTGPSLASWLGPALLDPAPATVAGAVELVVKRRLRGHYDALLALAARGAAAPVDVRLALVEGFVALTGDEGDEGDEKLDPKRRARMEAWLAKTASDDPSAFVRDKARRALGKGEDPGNDFRGLPRPDEPLLGLELAGDGAWLDTHGIARLARRIRARAPKVRFETTAGAFTVALDAAAAPAHAASLLLAAHAGIYDGTRFHRVVPNFVIQGGDPTGTGAGHAGWTVPDEISPLPYVRGALGMPKSRKDDGGCQIFVMHTAYRPLNERYTCYGNVVEGLDVVDRIRVGDVIRRAVVVE